MQADTFGECAIPTIAWQIDPFGHSKEQVFMMMMMMMEYDAMVIVTIVIVDIIIMITITNVTEGSSLCGNGL